MEIISLIMDLYIRTKGKRGELSWRGEIISFSIKMNEEERAIVEQK
jgi:hypothetical protein